MSVTYEKCLTERFGQGWPSSAVGNLEVTGNRRAGSQACGLCRCRFVECIGCGEASDAACGGHVVKAAQRLI